MGNLLLVHFQPIFELLLEVSAHRASSFVHQRLLLLVLHKYCQHQWYPLHEVQVSNCRLQSLIIFSLLSLLWTDQSFHYQVQSSHIIGWAVYQLRAKIPEFRPPEQISCLQSSQHNYHRQKELLILYNLCRLMSHGYTRLKRQGDGIVRWQIVSTIRALLNLGGRKVPRLSQFDLILLESQIGHWVGCQGLQLRWNIR